MNKVTEQYDAYPYPERDPRDEARRLVEGSPSDPVEIDHFLFSGQRDWSQPLRALVAGGGTGDGLIQLAQKLTSAGRPYDITYLDLSASARKIAEARARARGLTGITFRTGDLMQAPDLGRFDYIDCCGVLHHLPDPLAGFRALQGALNEGGGLGFMVYAPHGRAGVYPIQSAMARLFGDLPPEQRLKKARALLKHLPEAHAFRRNTVLVDHRESDAGFYDLLLHSQDRPFSVPELLQTLGGAGLELVSFVGPVIYDPSRFGEVPDSMSAPERMALAEELNGAIKMHVGYAVRAGRGVKPAGPGNPGGVPHLVGIGARPLAGAVASGKGVRLSLGVIEGRISLPKQAAGLIAQIDGRRSLADIAAAARLDPIAMNAAWGRIDAALRPWGKLAYSRLLVRG